MATILMEIKSGDKWEVVRGDNKEFADRMRRNLEKIESDPVKKLVSTFDGTIASYRKKIKENENIPNWIEKRMIPVNAFWDMIANVQLGFNIIPFKKPKKANAFEGIDLSEEAELYFKSKDYVHKTVLTGDKIGELEEYVVKNKIKRKYNNSDFSLMKMCIEEIFKVPIEMHKEKIKNLEDVRFLIAYETL